jgi:very-short-patch-repair endonuclease/tetratricopeptide (TPR) repeat protein
MPSIADQLDEARKNELLDLTLRNPLISHRTLKSRGIEVIDERPAAVYRILVEQERRMSFDGVSEEEKQKLGDEQYDMVFGQPDEEKTEEEAGTTGTAERHVDTVLQTPYTSAQLQKRLLNTFYHAQRSIREEGINTLYLALGMLRWYRSPSAEKERKAPVLLVPVELDRTDVQGRFRLQYTGEEIGGNLSLRAFLDGEFGLDWPLPPDPEDEALSVQDYFHEVEEVIQGQSRWRIDHHALELGFFSFTRFLMYEDLDVENWPEDDRPDEHPVLRRVLAEGFEPPEGRISKETHLDAHLNPEDTHHVVEADSSQTRAILDVETGCNLVLQGPPGTGKSQTITNIIAEAIGQGQSVLFVSEKMAALEVVKRNLDSVGLGDACLELHSHKTNKKSVLGELERTLKLGKPKVEDATENRSVFLDARQQLNAYAEAVNTPIGESGVRPYTAYGELVQLRGALSGVQTPPLDLPSAREWSREAYEDRRFLVEQVESHLSGMGVPTEHPFWGSQKTSYLPKEQEDIERAAASANETLDALRTAARELADTLQLGAPASPEDVGRLLAAAVLAERAPDLSGIPVTADAWHVQPEALQDLVEAGARYADLKDRYNDLLIPEAWEQDVFAIRQGLAKHGEKWYRWFLSEWREANGDLAALCRGDLPSGAQERVDVADAILETQRLTETLQENKTLGTGAFGPAWRGPSSDWDRLLAVTEYLREVRQDVDAGHVPENFLDTLNDNPGFGNVAEQMEAVQERQARHDEATKAFVQAIELDERIRFGESSLAEQPYDAQEEVLTRSQAETPRIQQMVTYNQLADELSEKELEAVESIARSWEHGPEHLTDLFDRVYYNELLQRAMDERPALKRFSGDKHERVIERFRELDRASLQHNRHEMALKHYERKPRRSGAGQMRVLQHEFGKKSRHMPLRTLMQKAGNAIQGLKPIFMMSPMSVPKYLPPESIEFDLVVFDEASQVRPVDAFGSILRGDQTVVVGDSKQLPPTSFFDSAIESDSDDFEPQASDQESILDLFRAQGAPEQMLRFHYRSRHESLIAVSNKEFYDNDLNVFPSPDAGQTETGLVYHHLEDTTYDRGGSRKNKEEARIVAEKVMEHARERPDMSLGVATFSSAQQEAIRDQLEYKRRQDPSCESFFSGHPDEPFFVKNLESVQGDQRDVIYISVGYGRDANGKVTMNFGPLNQDGGERRLNVLTTRAKYRCEVFTNLKAEDIDLHSTNARGVEVLKEYLKFAETGELDLPTPTGRGADSPFEKAVADRLREEGYRVEHQVGVAGFYIDLAVVDPDRPGRYLLGIECDGATYHSAKMARVRDRTRQAVLEDLGWRIHRIWSTDWFRNPGDQLAKAVTAIERARVEAEAEDDADEEGGGPENGEAPQEPVPQEHTTTIERAEEETEAQEAVETDPYEKARLNVTVLDDLHNTSRSTLGQWIREVVRKESPIHEDVAMRRVTHAAGVSRMGSRIQDALQEGIRYAAREGWIKKKRHLLLLPDQEDIPVRDRSDLEGRMRDIEYVPGPEIAAAARQIAEVSYGIDKDELIQQVGRKLGFRRVGSKIRERIGSIIDTMLEKEMLVRKNGHLTVPE